MRYYLLVLPILIGNLFLTEFAKSADRSSGINSTRWGITTKVPVEENDDVNEEVTGKEADLNKNHKNNFNDKKKLIGEDDQEDAEAEEKNITSIKNQTKENKSVEIKSVKEKQSDTIVPGKTKDIVTKEPGKKSNEQKEALIKWKNEAQKTKCNAYLASLKESFLKARHYSIQGVPCGTAENARSFMTLIDNCKRDCPVGFLKKRGYTSRIIRNLSWLEKLGSERCPDMNSNLPP
jgi:hypothetical protein